VDVETDSKVQRTIQTEFATSTLLCIAHRLNTIGKFFFLIDMVLPYLVADVFFFFLPAHYDRIIVMDDGKVSEFDTVLNLFDKTDSIFRSLCDEASLDRTDILRLQAEHAIVRDN
jgi:ATP-binding cassette subfamily C (CFTR/MRP) protein 1